MAEDHPEELPETSTEPPVSEHEAAVAAAVPLDDLILRILDEQAALADQLRARPRRPAAPRHDVTMTLALAETLANGQTAVLDELRAIRELARDGDRVRRLEGDPYLNLLGRRKVIGTIRSMPGTYPLSYMSPDTWIDNIQAFVDDPFGLLSYPSLDGTGRPVDPYQPTKGRYPAELAADEVAHGAQSRDALQHYQPVAPIVSSASGVWATAPLVP